MRKILRGESLGLTLGVCGKVCRCTRRGESKDSYQPSASPGIRQRSAAGGRVPISFDKTQKTQLIDLHDVESAGKYRDVIPTITDCEYVASYNWLDGKNPPTILVPGKSNPRGP
jgi:hypothetical protein